MALLWGVKPFLIDFSETPSVDAKTAMVILKERAMVNNGDTIVFVCDAEIDGHRHKTLQLHEVC